MGRSRLPRLRSARYLRRSLPTQQQKVSVFQMRSALQSRLDQLWLLAIVLFVGGDIITTVIGLQLGAVESNPLVDDALYEYGVPGMIALKTVAVAIIYGIGTITQKQLTACLTLLSISVLIVVWNTAIILQLL